jgi:uncharacterized protein
MTSVGTVSEIRRYPVKSMHGEKLETATLGPTGIHGDRLFAVRDIASGKILSAKTPKVGVALLSCSARTDDQGQIIVTVTGVDFSVDDPALAPALSSLLDRDTRVERATGRDEVYESYWPEISGMALSDVTTDLPIAMSTNKGTFADLAALHLLSTGSVAYLQSLNPDLELSMDRFRPGISIETDFTGAFVEKDWTNRQASVGGATLLLGVESPRCVMTTLEQPGLPRQPAVLQTIAQHNRTEFAGFGNFACLGIYAEVSAAGEIAVGDELTWNDCLQ